MYPTARRLAAGSLAAVAMLAAGPLATAGAKGGVPKPPRPVQNPQVLQAPQAPQSARIKTVLTLLGCGNAAKGKLSYEQNALGNFVTAEISNAAPGILVNVAVNGTTLGSMTTDVAGAARQVFSLAAPLAQPVTSAQIAQDGGAVLVASAC